MQIRQLHARVGLVFAVLFLVLGTTGALLLLRKAGLYAREIKELLVGLHTWEIAAPYVGGVLAAGLLLMSITGLWMAAQTARRSRARKD